MATPRHGPPCRPGRPGWARAARALAFLLAAGVVRPSAAGSIWSVGRPVGHVEVRDDLPAPGVFFREYVLGGPEKPFRGSGKPVLFRGAAKRMPAYRLWTDDYLRARHGSVTLDQVETEKKETRTVYPIENYTLLKFLTEYEKKDIYSTAVTPKKLMDEVYVLPMINCGGFHKQMGSTVLWFSSGGTKSAIHNDQQHNFHCMFAGQKQWILWHPKNKIQSRSMGWVNAEEEAKTDPRFQDAYGSYGGFVDVDNVDLDRFPQWNKLGWWNMTLDEGDCAYIPSKWFHYVEARPQRSISVHVWFHSGSVFDEKSCEALQSKGHDISRHLFRLSDCTWGFGEEGSRKPTKCVVRKILPTSEEL